MSLFKRTPPPPPPTPTATPALTAEQLYILGSELEYRVEVLRKAPQVSEKLAESMSQKAHNLMQKEALRYLEAAYDAVYSRANDA